VAEEYFLRKKSGKDFSSLSTYARFLVTNTVRRSNTFFVYAIYCLIRKVKIEDRFSTMTEREQEIIIQKKIANVSLEYLLLVYLYSPRAVLMLSVVLRRTTMEDNENLDCI
jgi:hypothetical protein